MARLGTGLLGETRLGETVWGDSVEGGQSVRWKQSVDLASTDDWPVIIDMEIVLKFLDPSKVASYNFTVDGECTTDVDWTVKSVDNETGEVVIDVDVKVDCPDGQTWSGALTGNFDYDGTTGIESTSQSSVLKQGTGDQFETSGSADGSANTGSGTEGAYPGTDWDYDRSSVSVGHSCTPNGHTATVPVRFNEDTATKEYQIVVEWDPNKLSYLGYNGTPPDYTDTNNSQAYYFENATINQSSGRLVMTSTDDETIQPFEPRLLAGVYDSGYLGSLQFDVLAAQGSVADLTIVESETWFKDADGRTLTTKTYDDGEVAVENGLSIGNDTARPEYDLTVPVQIQAGTDVAGYDVTLEFPYKYVDFTSATGVDLPDPTTDVDVVTKDVSGPNQDSLYRKFGRLHLSADQDVGVRDPHLCDVTFTALIAYFSAGQEGNVTVHSAEAVAADGSDIPLSCNSPGMLTITNPKGADKNSIPCDSFDAYPVSVTRTFVTTDIKTSELDDMKIRVESSTNPTEVERHWVAIPYQGDSTMAAINATITVKDPDGNQVCPADITTYIEFYWEDGSITSSGLYAGEGVHYGGVKGLFGGGSLSTVGNTRGNFGPGFQF